MKKEIYIIRHGQTEYNKKGIVQGSGVNSELNETGKAQARSFFEMYRHIKFDKVYTSTLKRAIQSVGLFIEEQKIPHQTLQGLNEIDWGEHEGKAITTEQNNYYLYMLKEWKKGNLEVAIDGGESPLQVQERQKKALDYILKQESEEKVLICMHGRALRILLCLMLDYPLENMDKFEHQNLCLYKLQYTGTLFRIEEFCNTEHLKNLVLA